jgi:Ribbon-helix-helix protein
MEPKTARITILIDPGKKLALEKLCAEQDVTPSQVVRRLIRDYLANNGVTAASAPAEQQAAQRA